MGFEAWGWKGFQMAKTSRIHAVAAQRNHQGRLVECCFFAPAKRLFLALRSPAVAIYAAHQQNQQVFDFNKVDQIY